MKLLSAILALTWAASVVSGQWKQEAEASLFWQPRKLTVHAQPSALSEQQRLSQQFQWLDLTTTGFFLNRHQVLKVTVSGLAFGSKARLGFGPPALVDPDNTANDLTNHVSFGYSKALKNGVDKVSHSQAGIIYVQYTYKGKKAPGPIKVTIGPQAQPFPYYEEQKSGSDEAKFIKALENTTIPFAELSGQRVVVTGLARTAKKYMFSKGGGTKIKTPLEAYSRVINAQDKISGLSNSNGEKALHRPSPLRPLVVETIATKKYGADAWDFRAAISQKSSAAIWSLNKLNKSWVVWHELGHQRQHNDTWSWPGQVEVTVEIYTLAARRSFPETPNYALSRLKRDEWVNATRYLDKADREKDFEKEHFRTRLVMFEQLRLAFGDVLYAKIHCESREFAATGRKKADKDKKTYFMTLASTHANVDLGDFFTKWGMRPSKAARQIMAKQKKPHQDYTKLEVYGTATNKEQPAPNKQTQAGQ